MIDSKTTTVCCCANPVCLERGCQSQQYQTFPSVQIQYLPIPLPDVRKGIVTWMRNVADLYAQHNDLIGDGYARNWRLIADLIEQEADTRPITEVP